MGTPALLQNAKSKGLCSLELCLTINVSWPAPCRSSEKAAETGFIPSWLIQQEINSLKKKSPPPPFSAVSLLVFVTTPGHLLACRDGKGQCKNWFWYFQICLFWWQFSLLSQLLQHLVVVAAVWKQKAKQAQCSLWMYNKLNILKYDLASSLESPFMRCFQSLIIHLVFCFLGSPNSFKLFPSWLTWMLAEKNNSIAVSWVLPAW